MSSLPSRYVWESLEEVPSSEVRAVRRSPLTTAKAPPWLDTGPTEELFHFSKAMRSLCEDVVLQSASFRHLDLSRILFTFTQARKGVRHGLQARVTPLRFRDGRETSRRRGRSYRVQQYQVEKKEILYLVDFCLPRYLDRAFEDKFVTLFHELYHISPQFDGDLRRHGGRYEFHTGSQKQYDRLMCALVRDYLTVGAEPKRYDFLRLTFDQLRARHGSVVGYRVPRPKVIPTEVRLADEREDGI
jgi:predicted metallopeptidase